MANTTTATRVTKKALKNAERAVIAAVVASVSSSPLYWVESAVRAADALGVVVDLSDRPIDLRDRAATCEALRCALRDARGAS